MTWEYRFFNLSFAVPQSILRCEAAEDLRSSRDDHSDIRNAYVYIVSNKSHRLYIGWTVDLLQRVQPHKTGTYENAFKDPPALAAPKDGLNDQLAK